MTGEGLGRAEWRHLVSKDLFDRLEFARVAHGCTGAVGVDVVHRLFHIFQRLPHATHRTLAGGRDHVITIRGGAIPGEFGVDLGAACACVFQLFHHQHAATAGDDKSIARDVVGARRGGRGIVVFGGQGAHGVEHQGHGPVHLFTATGKHHILLAHLDEFSGIADTVGAGGAGGADGVVDALNAEGCREAGRIGARHGACHHIRSDLAHALGAQQVHGRDHVGGGGAARADD